MLPVPDYIFLTLAVPSQSDLFSLRAEAFLPLWQLGRAELTLSGASPASDGQEDTQLPL